MIVWVNVVLNRTVVVSSLTTTQLQREKTELVKNASACSDCVTHGHERKCEGRKQGTVKFIFVVNCCCLGDIYICLTQSRDFVIYK